MTFSTWKRTKHKNWVALTFPFNKATPNISKQRRNTDIYVERKYISKPVLAEKIYYLLNEAKATYLRAGK